MFVRFRGERWALRSDWLCRLQEYFDDFGQGFSLQTPEYIRGTRRPQPPPSAGETAASPAGGEEDGEEVPSAGGRHIEVEHWRFSALASLRVVARVGSCSGSAMIRNWVNWARSGQTAYVQGGCAEDPADFVQHIYREHKQDADALARQRSDIVVVRCGPPWPLLMCMKADGSST